ncbi:o-succinylbenzoate--CoA ligase [Modestobacter roseus]|uniref:O-succinylbenzoic acid--CoA ligase n=1 Tax=Modestobacter roseus TaxID=1181884 RepID=A0A562IU06_9ACTN|nr:o-succinylbenzoate--CoA ligase [Modestobacter roseus]MQA36113.1 AMP-binding protein [Modestobacter roseus]TWH74422.1 O-succinylbenzoic acid--CoA ligase [Modestobacter roseus]
MPRQLTLVPAPSAAEPAAALGTVWPALRAALAGGAPLAVLPADPGPADAARQLLRPDEPLEPGTDLVVVTSGSTGSGKGVLLSAGALRASATATLDRLGGAGSWLLALPVSAVGGLQVLVRSALADREPVVLGRGEPLAAATARLPAGDRRYVSLVPTQLRRFLAEEPDALASFDGVLVGGAASDPALLAAAHAAGVRVRTTYGMSETAGGCVYDGVPLDGVSVRVADGGIELTGPVLAHGYRLDPAATAEAFAPGPGGGVWFRTRDAGSVDDDGRLTVHGRLDDVVISGGVNVSPPAVEARLREHPSVADAVVAGVPDPEWGQRVVAAVVAAPGAAPRLAELRPWVAERLGAAAAPKALRLIDTVPTLHTGKPDRRAVLHILGDI